MPDEARAFHPEAAVPQQRGSVVDISSIRLLQEITGRMCRIHTAFGSGTGFLIAPDLLMTASHVVQQARESCRGGGSISFSFSESVQGPETEIHAIAAADLRVEAQDEGLDYSIIRLPKKIGLARYDDAVNRIRGWFSIFGSSQSISCSSRSLILLQFPRIHQAQVAPGGAPAGATIFAFSSGEVMGRAGVGRLSHNAASEGGSSGGLCLTGRAMTPFALHIGSNQRELNFAVPLAGIVDHLRATQAPLYDELRSAPNTLLCPRVSRIGRPILNRDVLIARLVQMMGGNDQRPLYVTGVSQSGRTFVKEIVEAFRPDQLHRHVELHLCLDDYHKAAVHIARYVTLSAFRAPEYDPVEPIEAYFRRTLDAILLSIDQKAQLRQCVAFIYFDGLDVDTVVAKDLLAFLEALAPRYSNLRICASGSLAPHSSSLLDVIQLGLVRRNDYAVAAREFCTYHQVELELEILEAAVDAVIGADENVTAPLAIQADAAHNLCLELLDLAGRVSNP